MNLLSKNKERKRQLNNIMDNLPGMVYRCHNDEHWTIQFVSNGIKELLGFTPDDIINNKNISYKEIVLPEYREDLCHSWQEAVKNKQRIKNEYRVQTASGDIKWILEQGSGVYDDNGQLLFLEGLIIDITAQKQAEKEAYRREKDLAVTLQSIGDAVITTDLTGKITRMNAVSAKLTGWPIEEGIGEQLTDVFKIINTISRKPLKSPVDKVLKQGKTVGLANDTSLISRKGKEYQIADSAAPIVDKDNKMLGVILVFHDVSEAYRQRRALAKSEKQYRALFEHSINAFAIHKLVLDKNGKPKDYIFLQANKAFEKHTGIKVKDIINKPATAVYPGIENTGLIEKYGQVVLTGESISFEYYFEVSKRHYNISAYAVADDKFAVVFEDITERIKDENRLKYLTFHDPVTNVYNRTFLEEEINRLDTKRQLPLSLIMADVNGLKIINDSFGHQEGDRLLQKVAKVIKNATREEDIVSRWGGDEFVILLPKTFRKEVSQVCSRIEKACDEIKDNPYKISVSFGYATKETADQDINLVLKEAEDYMYQRKMTNASSNKSALLTSLQKALGEKSHETLNHAYRLEKLSVALAKKIGLSDSKIEEVSLLALLHDIGKVAISKSILNKPDSLTKEEEEIIQKHPEIGNRIAAASPDLLLVSDGVLSHHEWWDGTGYPKGLKGEEIPLSARIVSLVDAFEAMTSDRPYRNAMNEKEAIKEIKNGAGSQFDPNLVKAFLKIIEDKNIN